MQITWSYIFQLKFVSHTIVFVKITNIPLLNNEKVKKKQKKTKALKAEVLNSPGAVIMWSVIFWFSMLILTHKYCCQVAGKTHKKVFGLVSPKLNISTAAIDLRNTSIIPSVVQCPSFAEI